MLPQTIMNWWHGRPVLVWGEHNTPFPSSIVASSSWAGCKTSQAWRVCATPLVARAFNSVWKRRRAARPVTWAGALFESSCRVPLDYTARRTPTRSGSWLTLASVVGDLDRTFPCFRRLQVGFDAFVFELFVYFCTMLRHTALTQSKKYYKRRIKKQSYQYQLHRWNKMKLCRHKSAQAFAIYCQFSVSLLTVTLIFDFRF